jgi:IS5 family transposase
MLLISNWYDLSDVQTEVMVNDSISALKFCDLSIEDDVPGHSTLSRFRKILIDKKAYDNLLEEIDQQLSKQQLKVIIGHAKVDAKLSTL